MENLGLGLEDTGFPRRWSRGAVSLRNRRGDGTWAGLQGPPREEAAILGLDFWVLTWMAEKWWRLWFSGRGGREGGELGVRTPQSLMEGAGGLDSGFPGLQKLGKPLRF